MNPGLEQAEPGERADRQVGGESLHVALAHQEDDQEPTRRARHPSERHGTRVEDRDHDDRTDLVGHRQGEQEPIRSDRYPRAEQLDDADREGDLRVIGMA